MTVTVRERDPSDDLSEKEVAYINSSEGSCPLCLAGGLVGGPRGGVCQNFICDGCLCEFNLTLWPGDREHFVIDGQHIRDASGREAYRLRTLRERWGVLDEDPPPGVSAEEWQAIQAEAAEAMNKLGRDPGETAGPRHSEQRLDGPAAGTTGD
jgi:hypothetical protein